MRIAKVDEYVLHTDQFVKLVKLVAKLATCVHTGRFGNNWGTQDSRFSEARFLREFH